MNKYRLEGDSVPICDYEGSDYRTRFWENQGREYEDLVERIALRHLLPSRGKRLLEIGAGFGRLVDMYQGYEQIVLLDYSKSMLRQAQERLGRDARYTYVAADIYRMPLIDGAVDTVSMVRVIHHLADVSGALRQIHRVIRPAGTFVLEFASKFHLKALLRYVLGRQSWSPFEREPVEFVSLNFDFHPLWMRAQLDAYGFQVERVRTVSHLRIPFLKRLVPARLLAALDGALQWTGQWWQLSPSIFFCARRMTESAADLVVPDLADPSELFICPACGGRNWHATDAELRCQGCEARWRIDDGIYDFKSPL